jgi:hypothetical protein
MARGISDKGFRLPFSQSWEKELGDVELLFEKPLRV